jgi:hypothetical protein
MKNFDIDPEFEFNVLDPTRIPAAILAVAEDIG